MAGLKVHLLQGRVAGVALGAALLAYLALAPTASAAITPTRDASTAAGAIADSAPGGSWTGSAFTEIPPNPTPQCSNGIDDDGDQEIDSLDGECASPTDNDERTAGEQPVDTTGINPASTADTALASFPGSGATYAILGSGDTTVAANANDSESTGTNNQGVNYPAHEGATNLIYDLVTLRLDLQVPADANCAKFQFRFLSEEFTEFVGSGFNDAFLAELDASNFTVDPTTKAVAAPNNFAFDAAGNPVTVNTAGFSAANAAGTTYDGATALLAAVTPISPGAHSIFLSLYDAGDSSYDSAVFLDKLELGAVPAEDCVRGAQVPQQPPDGLPDPIQGVNVNLRPLGGRVRVDVPRDGMGFFPIEEATQVPVRTRVDTRNGIVELTSARKMPAGATAVAAQSGETTQTAVFRSGLFRVLQGTESDRTTADLVGPFNCSEVGPRGGREARRRKRGRSLWGSGKGRFTSKGRHGSASTRGTVWLLFDRCNRVTGTRVKEGRVVFRDFYERRKEIVRAGETALAIPPQHQEGR